MFKANVLEVALERPAVGHLLAAGDPRLRYPRQHEPFGRTALGHARNVAGPEQGATASVPKMLKLWHGSVQNKKTWKSGNGQKKRFCILAAVRRGKVFCH